MYTVDRGSDRNMNNCTITYLEDDVKELERLRGLIKAEPDNKSLYYEYKRFFMLFLTTLKIAVNDGTLNEYDAWELREKYSSYTGEE